MSEGRADALRPGHRLHVYTIGEVLGAGGFGITYRGEEEFTHRQVAIKEFLPNVVAFRASDGVGVKPISEGAGRDFAWGLERFRREARTLYDLRHPNIVPVLQYFEANGTGYLVMEYQSGAALGALLRHGHTLDPSELDEILEPLLEGLAAMHAKGFLHRDLKPDNIFIRTDGSPLLLDFGAARQALGERSQSLTTIISEGYAPFEQYESSGNQGPWTDIYALGATLYRCITGVKPAPAPARVMARMRNSADPLAPVAAAAREHYGERLVQAMEAAMRVDAPQRPQSIEAFRALLREPTPEAAETIVSPAAAAAATVVPEHAGTIAVGRTPRAAETVRAPPAPPVRPRARRNEPVPPPPMAAPSPPTRAATTIVREKKSASPEEERAPPADAARYRRGRVWFVFAWLSVAASLTIVASWIGSLSARELPITLAITVLPGALMIVALVFATRGSMIAYGGLVFLQFAYLAMFVFLLVVALGQGFHPIIWNPLSIYLVVGWAFIPFLGPAVRAYVRGRRGAR